MLGDRNIGIAAEAGERAGDVLLLRRQLFAGDFVGVVRLVVLRLRGGARREQALLPLQFALLIDEGGLGGGGVGLLLLIGRLHRLDLEPDRRQLRLGLLDGDAERPLIEAEQHLASFHQLVVANIDFGNAT